MANKKHYPEEYIRGWVEFFGRKFFVNENVLIPRLETEFLVREARKVLMKKSIHTIVDIGTGSGIIGLSLADFDLPIQLIDISDTALEVARSNAKNLFPQNTNISFQKSDLLENVQLGNNICPKKILLVANLPYIKDGDIEHMSEDTEYEPSLALFGGEDTGFELYESLFTSIKERDITESIGIFEFGFDQKNTAQKILEQYDWKYTFFADHAGIDRFVRVEF